MAYDEPPTNPSRKRPDGWSDSTADRDVRRGRHRARHADAAPDAYDGGHDEDTYGFAYGDGVSAQPMYGPAPEGWRNGAGRPTSRPALDAAGTPPTTGRRRGEGGPPTGEMPRAGRPTGATAPAPVDPSWRLSPPGASRPAPPDRPSGSGMSAQARSNHPGQRALDGPTRPVPQLDSPRPDNVRPDNLRLGNPRADQPRADGPRSGGPRSGDPQPGGRWPDRPRPEGARPDGPQAGVARNVGRQSPAEVEAGADPPKTGRAGRNLPKAIGVGVLLAGIVLGSLFLWRPAFVAVLAVGACVGVWEMVHAFALPGPTTAGRTAPAAPTTSAGPTAPIAGTSAAPTAPAAPTPPAASTTPSGPVSRAEPPLVPLIGGCLVMAPLAYFGGVESLVLGLLVTILAVIVWRLSSGPVGFARDISAATLIAAYVPFLLFFGILLARPDDGDLRVLCILAMVVLSDTGGYAAGVFFGKHPMAPSVSPKKSWEGLAGSLVATGVGGAFLVHYLLHQPYWQGAIIGVAVSAAAVLGDLAESMLKRDLGVKDMSNLLPGHGGVMDRLDSVVFAAPTAFVLLAVFAPVAT
jgi:phosphatidate cytidylyltransferase